MCVKQLPNEGKITASIVLKDDYPGQSAQAAAAAAPQQPRVTEPIKAAPRVGRNEPCPCGSGKKYKNCHGKGL